MVKYQDLNLIQIKLLRSGSLKNSNEAFNTGNKFTWTSENANTLGITFPNNNQMNNEYNLITKKSRREFYI